MPVTSAQSALKTAFENSWTQPELSNTPRATMMGQEIGSAINNAISPTTINLQITGALPGTPPPPYAGVEVITGVYDVAKLIDDIAEIEGLWSNPASGNAITYAADEATIYAEAIFSFIQSAQYPLLLHQGNITATPLPASALAAAMIPGLVAVYSVNTGVASIKANAVATTIDTALAPWVMGTTFSGMISTSPAGPLAGGTTVGAYV